LDSLPQVAQLVLFSCKDLIESEHFLAEHGNLILILREHAFIISELHYLDFHFLHSLFVVINLTIAVFEKFSCFADFVFES
jgi:hypothetical protein